MKEIERQLHNSILKEKEESLKSHKQHEAQVFYYAISCSLTSVTISGDREA
jgi:hypothetical protein